MTTLLAFIFVLGVLVFVHEAGHFLTAKWVGVKVNVFSLGFPPKLVGRKWGDTEYRIGVLPIGGYVKMAGDNPLESTGDPEEFLSRARWERLAILFAGPLMNLVTAVLILTALFMVGIDRPAGLEDPAVVRFIAEDSPAASAGIENGDQIVAIDDRPIATWSEALDTFLVNANESLSVRVERDGQPLELTVDVEGRGDEQVGYAGVFPAVQPKISRLTEGFPAEAAGLKEGDVITKVGDSNIFHFTELIKAVEEAGGEQTRIGVLREKQYVEVNLTPKKTEDRWLIGIEFDSSPMVTQRITNPVLAFSAALDETARFTRLTFVVLGRLVTGRASVRQMSGPIDIARISGETARRGARELFTFMAFLSLNLGILNLLPIPLLDGGHMAIISMEGLAGRDFSLAVKERILQVGFVMLLLLMVTVIYVDLSKIESIGRYLPW